LGLMDIYITSCRSRMILLWTSTSLIFSIVHKHCALNTCHAQRNIRMFFVAQIILNIHTQITINFSIS
jgi:hypothetical protein